MDTRQIAPTLVPRWQEPSWYHALSLRERIATLNRSEHAVSTVPSSNGERAQRRLQAWKAKKPFDQGEFFAQRLSMDALTEEELTFLLAEPISALQTRYLRTSPQPAWLVALRDAFEHYAGKQTALTAEGESGGSATMPLYLQPLLPLLERSRAQLAQAIQQLRQQYDVLPFDPQQIAQALLAYLPEQILGLFTKTFVLEMHVARLQNQLTGETAEARFADFVRQLSQEEKILALLEEYPVLARQLVVTIEHWACFAQELLTHLCADWADICATFSPEHDPGTLIDVRGGVGDLHRKGHGVLICTFSSGLQLLYKPKSLTIDVHFQQLLTWLNEHGAQPAFRTMKLLARDGYGWSEFISAYSCSSQEEVARFYARQGSYLALLYALNAADCHVENLIAAGEHPFLVDLEALFHPQVGGDDPTQPYYLSMTAMDQTVFRVGLLPYRIWSNKDTIGVDLSGLGGHEGQMTPNALPKWNAAGTDQMKLVRERKEIPVKQNRPRLNGSDVNVLDYRATIIDGFTNMYRLLCDVRAALAQEMLPRFADDEIRLVLRPTQRYAKLLQESFHPDLLRDALERERYFDYLWREVPLRPYLARVIAAERFDLLRGDIPIFTTTPASRTIFTSEGEALPDFFDQPSMELVKQRLTLLNEEDLARQLWVIEATLSTLLMGPERVTGKSLKVKPSQRPASRERLMAAARAIGKRLEELAVTNDYGASWLGVSVVNESAWSLLPTDIDLYSGTSGIALFLAYLGAVTGEACYTRQAKLALASVRSQAEQQKQYLNLINMGMFDGIGSVIYLLTHLGKLWNEPELLQEAVALAELLPPLIARDEQRDIISGSAGCLLTLLNLHAVSPSPRLLELARQCGDHLLATQQAMAEGIAWVTIKHEKPLGGFAHGTSGIALSLLKLAAVTGEERYRRAALDALVYDRSLYVPEKHNWQDLRSIPSSLANAERDAQDGEVQTRQHKMIAWCHGASGIGLSRLAILPYLDDAMLPQEIDIVINKIMAEGLNENHSLCHGMLGNLDVILGATQALDEPRYYEQLGTATAMVLDSIDEYGWVAGVPLGVETPGLMLGLAGIGYELLRLAVPEQVPSVLSVAPPLH